MKYLLDIFAAVPVVVLSTDDVARLADVGQRYATQVGRPLVVADGPLPADAQFLPLIPAVIPSLPSLTSDVAPPAPKGSVLVSFDPALITTDQRAYLKSIGVHIPE